jgi:inosine-uridine nucleoside N-ribohydrolase
MQYPGILRRAKLVLMGGYVYPTRLGFPQWDSDMDFNIQIDVRSAKHVLLNSNPTLVPLTVTVETALRRAYLERLRGAGALGKLLARQAEAFAEDEQHEKRFGETCPGLPRDIINFQHDPLACAIALGWQEDITLETLHLEIVEENGKLYERVTPGGKPIRVVTKIDGPRFNQFWFEQVTRR